MASRRKCPACGAPFAKGFAQTECPSCGQLLRPARKPEAKSAPASLVTRTLGRVTLGKPVSSSSRAIVYRLPDTRGKRELALKVFPDAGAEDSPEGAALRAAVAAFAGARHPALPVVHEHGEADGRVFVLLDWVEGAPLRDNGSQPPLPASLAARLVAALAEAVHHLHQLGTIPPQLAAGEVLVDAAGRPKLTGPARPRAAGKDVTAAAGAPGMLPPEWLAGAPPAASVRSNVYALGALLHLLLTGAPPFRAATEADTRRLVQTAEPPAPGLLNSLIPAELDAVVARCLAKEPGRRYDTAQALADDLGRFLRSEPRPAGLFERLAPLGRWFRRRPARALGAILLAGGLAALGVSGLHRWHGQQERLVGLLTRQAVADSLAGRSDAARQGLAEAAALRPDAALRQLAIEVLSRPHLEPLVDVAFGQVHRLWFSAGGELLAVTGRRVQGPLPRSPNPVVAVYALPAGRFLGDLPWDPKSGPPRFHPREPWLAVPQSSSRTALWVPRSGQPPNRLPAGGLVLFNPAGTRLAVGSVSLRIFDVTSMSEVARRPLARPVVWTSADELLVRTAERVARWNVRTGLLTLLGADNEQLLAVSDDGQMTAWRMPRAPGTAGLSIRRLDDQTEIWRPPGVTLGGPEPVFLFRHHGELAFLKDAVDPALVRVLDVHGRRHLGAITRPGLDFRPGDGRPAAAGSGGWWARAAEPDPASPDRDLASAVTADGRWLAAALTGPPATLEIQDLREGRLVGVLSNVFAPRWQAEGRCLGAVQSRRDSTTAGRMDHVLVWALVRPAPVVRGPQPIPQIRFAAAGTQLAAGGRWYDLKFQGGNVELAETGRTTGGAFLGGGSPERTWAATNQVIQGGLPLALRAPDGSRVVLPGGSETARLAFSPDGRQLLVARTSFGVSGGSRTNWYECWDLRQRRSAGVWPAPPDAGYGGPLEYAPDGRLVASACFVTEGVELLDAANGERQRWLLQEPTGRVPGARLARLLGRRSGVTNSPSHRVKALRFTAAGARLVAGTAEGWLVVCNVATGAVELAVPRHEGGIKSLAVSPDGAWAATSGADGLVRLTRLSDGAELARWRGRRTSFRTLEFSPDGFLLAAGADDGLLQIWNLRRLRDQLAAWNLDW